MYNISKYNRDEFLTPFDSLFDDLLASHFPKLNSDLGGNFFAKGSYPRVDVIEKPDKLVLEAEIHGLAKEDVSVDLEGDALVIKGTKRQSNGTEKDKYLLREIRRSSFQRSFVVGENIDKTKIKADFKDGLLTVELPRLKPEEVKPDRIKLL